MSTRRKRLLRTCTVVTLALVYGPTLAAWARRLDGDVLVALVLLMLAAWLFVCGTRLEHQRYLEFEHFERITRPGRPDRVPQPRTEELWS